MKSDSDVLSNVDYDSQKSCYERSKKDNIHHFADEFAFEDLKRESGVRVHITPSSILLKMASSQ